MELFLQFLEKILWRWQVWRNWNGHRLVVISCRKKTWRTFFPEKRDEWNAICSRDCTDPLTVDPYGPHFPLNLLQHRQEGQEEKTRHLQRRVWMFRNVVYAAKRFVAMIEKEISVRSAANDARKELWKILEMGHWQNSCHVRTNKGLSCFCPKWLVRENRKHIKPIQSFF